MKRIILLCAAITLTVVVTAQLPEKMSYQAVVRNSNNQPVTNQLIGMQISIIQGSVNGAGIYVETQSPTSNSNGLISLVIGEGTVQSGNFSSINWANGPYFIKTETDPSGGTNYTISGTSQLLSVPYALHAKTAETLSGTINESDPVFSAWDKSTGISVTESQISDFGTYVEAETDPVFGLSVASGISEADTANWNDKLDSYTESDPVFGTWDKSTGISVTESQISDFGTYVEVETDPVFGLSVASGISEADTASWNDKLDSFTESDPEFGAWDKSTGISVTESQISDFGAYVETETDPVFGLSVAGGITEADTASWNDKLDSYAEIDPSVTANFDFNNASEGDLLRFNGNKWVKFSPNYSEENHKHLNATSTDSGFLSIDDKNKLDELSNINIIAGDGIVVSGTYPNITITSKGATYRWATFTTYDQQSWACGNTASLFGGVNPSNWTDNNYLAANMPSDKEVLRTIFTQKGYASKNAMIMNDDWMSYSSTNGKVVMALFRIKNTTENAITWTPWFYCSAYGAWGEKASLSLNGADTWNTISSSNASVSLSIPASRTSTVIFVSTSGSPVNNVRNCRLAFYNNSLLLPVGLEFVDDLDTATGGWEQ